MQPTSRTNGTHPEHAPHTPPPSGPGAKPQAAERRRDNHGRFDKGNAGGPGNPFARQVAALRVALLSAVTARDVAAVAQELLRQAKEGNLAAAKLLLSYTLGKPAAAPVDPDTLDLHEFGLYQRLPDAGPVMVAAGRRVGLPFALEYLRTALPGFSAAQQRMLTDGIAAQVEQEGRQAAAREKRRAGRSVPQRPRKKARPGQAKGAAAPKLPSPPPTPEEAQAVDLLAELLGLTGLPAPPSGAEGLRVSGDAPSPNGDDGRREPPQPPADNG